MSPTRRATHTEREAEAKADEEEAEAEVEEVEGEVEAHDAAPPPLDVPPGMGSDIPDSSPPGYADPNIPGHPEPSPILANQWAAATAEAAYYGGAVTVPSGAPSPESEANARYLEEGGADKRPGEAAPDPEVAGAEAEAEAEEEAEEEA